MVPRNDGGRIPAAEDLQLLTAYHEAGFKMLPLHPENKNPRGNGWQLEQTRKSLEYVEGAVKRGDGVGLQAGKCSGWLCAVDLDSKEAQKLAPYFLRPTLTSGKESEELPSHYVYISEGAGYRKIKDPDKNSERGELVCLKASDKAKGQQFVVAPSVHATKGRYIWHGGFDAAKITKISADELDMHVSRLGAATLIACYLPQGGRHEYAMALAGLLLRNGEDEAGALELMRPAWEIAGAPDKAFQDLEAIVEDTRENLDAGERVIGGGWLNEECHPKFAQAIGKALGWGRPHEEQHKDYARTDTGNAERLVDTYGEHIRYCYPWRAWLLWDGSRWARDDSGKIYKLAKSVARHIHEDAARTADTDEQKAINRWAIQSQSEQRINSLISLARSEVAVSPDALDADPMLLTVENGTLDLRTGELRASRPQDMITKLAPVSYNPEAPAPRFEQFLSEIFPGDEELVGFVRRFAGYSLTGSTEERCVAILHGAGKNGKSTLVELLRHVMGDYARGTDVETILAKRYQGVGNDVAALKGARFVSTSEIDKGRRLAESKVKQLTGSDTVTARFLFSEPFDFRPEFKLWISTNNKPEIQGTDNAIWDRLRLIPFAVRFEGKGVDTDLPRKLRNEAAGVLAWMVRGCVEWQREGLGEPAAVLTATEAYRAEMDSLAGFIEERCVVHPKAKAAAADLYDEYHRWCMDAGEELESKKKVGEYFASRGFERTIVGGGGPKRKNRAWKGIGLNPDGPDGEDGEDGEDSSETFQGRNPRVSKDSETSSTSSPSSTQEDESTEEGDYPKDEVLPNDTRFFPHDGRGWTAPNRSLRHDRRGRG